MIQQMNAAIPVKMPRYGMILITDRIHIARLITI
jgi:hypothetical protein